MSNIDLYSVLHMLGCGPKLSPVLSKYFPTCLCNISTRQLEQLLWRAGPTAQQLSQCLPCMASLTKRKWNFQCCATLWQGNLHKVAATYFYFYLSTWFSCIKKIGQSCICWAVRLAFQINSSKCLVLILHRHLGNFVFKVKNYKTVMICKIDIKDNKFTYQVYRSMQHEHI